VGYLPARSTSLRNGFAYPVTRIDSTRWSELSPLLDQALELSGEERAAWLQALRTMRPEVAAELQTLLAELQSLDAEGFLEGDPARMLSQR
jgi:hypothetical protein